jgi:hypothetical protein
VEHGCDLLLPGCRYRKATTDPPDCDHTFRPLDFEDGLICKWCGFVTNPAWATGDYGDNWEKVRENAIRRDNSECQSCGVSRTEHKREWGEDLHVHHKTPLREFKSPDKANKLSNLKTLCKSCHREEEWE